MLVLYTGWISRRVMPLDACESFRNCEGVHVTSKMSSESVHHNGTKPAIYLSLHVRAGDACDVVVDERPSFIGEIWRSGKRKCASPNAYAPVIRRMCEEYSVTDILLATDSQDFIEWALATFPEVNWHFQDYLDRRKLEHGKGWIEYRHDIGRVETESALNAVDLLSRGHVFIGSMCSHFSRSIFWAMVGRRNVLVPYASMDGCSLRNSRGKDHGSRKRLFFELFGDLDEL
jgi:hypothetical protein